MPILGKCRYIALSKQKLRGLLGLNSIELVFPLLDLVFRLGFCFGRAIDNGAGGEHCVPQSLYGVLTYSLESILCGVPSWRINVIGSVPGSDQLAEVSPKCNRSQRWGECLMSL